MRKSRRQQRNYWIIWNLIKIHTLQEHSWLR
jgi:hypothetical protein